MAAQSPHGASHGAASAAEHGALRAAGREVAGRDDGSSGSGGGSSREATHAGQHDVDQAHDDPHVVLKEYMIRHGLKASRQRDIIVDVFLTSGRHLRVDELLQQVRVIDPRVSQATVYRTMKLLSECGLAAARNFNDGQTRYEYRDELTRHHDHLICIRCHTIVEFVDERIETLQAQVAMEYGFAVTEHKMELYGVCRDCQQDAPSESGTTKSAVGKARG